MAMAISYNWLFLWRYHSINGATTDLELVRKGPGLYRSITQLQLLLRVVGMQASNLWHKLSAMKMATTR